MTKEKKTSGETGTDVAVMNGSSNEVITSAGVYKTQEDALSALKTMEEGIPLNGEFLNLEVGEELRCYVICPTTVDALNGEVGEKSPAIKLLSSEGRVVIAANAMIVSTLMEIAKECQTSGFPAPFSITCTGQEASKNFKGGSYKTFDIKPLGNKN